MVIDFSDAHGLASKHGTEVDLASADTNPAASSNQLGAVVIEHMTEPLWGVGTSGPYGHDGRSVTLNAVIRRHGGEASQVIAAYRRLNNNDRSMIVEFLQSLVLFPPDDTASSLRTGVPNSDDPQDPDNHGSINLGALFQIPEEGSE